MTFAHRAGRGASVPRFVPSGQGRVASVRTFSTQTKEANSEDEQHEPRNAFMPG
jgi:hypothetical protein